MKAFFAEHKKLIILLAVLLIAVGTVTGFLVRELRRDPGEPVDGTEQTEETTVPITEEETTAPPPHYYTEEGDAAYHPTAQTEDGVDAHINARPDHRIYTAFPVTNVPAFNSYCSGTVSQFATQAEGPATLREGGNTAVTVDYRFYRAEHVYSCVLTNRSVTEDAEGGEREETLSVRVLIYDTETLSVYAPLDIYDVDSDYVTALAALMRAGYEADLARLGLPVDTAFLDETCRADPSCFVNIAMDDTCLYFYCVYTPADGVPVLLRSAVPFESMRRYEHVEFPEPEEPVIPIEIPIYDISGAVPEREMVEDSYFDDALFIGNSLIVGLSRSVKLNATYFATVGLNVMQFFSKDLIPAGEDEKITMNEAIASVDFKKVYLMFGVNELGWGSISAFIDYYGRIIDRIREVNPSAMIYVQSILPVNEEKWAKSRDYQSSINNVSAATFNQKIVEMCNEKHAYFVNVAEVMTDETGNLFSDATTDGIHIGGIFSTRWVEYLRTHTLPDTPEALETEPVTEPVTEAVTEAPVTEAKTASDTEPPETESEAVSETAPETEVTTEPATEADEASSATEIGTEAPPPPDTEAVGPELSDDTEAP